MIAANVNNADVTEWTRQGRGDERAANEGGNEGGFGEGTDLTGMRRRLVLAGNGSGVLRLTQSCPYCLRGLRTEEHTIEDGEVVDGDLFRPREEGREELRDHAQHTVAARRQGPPRLPPEPEATVAQVMQRDVVCVKAEMSVEHTRTLFFERNITGAPVVDDFGHPIGVVSMSDLARDLVERDEPWSLDQRRPARPARRIDDDEDLSIGYHIEPIVRATVAEIMMPVVFQLPLEATVSRAAALMACEDVHRIVVVDEYNAVAGVISAIDVARWVARRAGYLAYAEPEPWESEPDEVRTEPDSRDDELPDAYEDDHEGDDQDCRHAGGGERRVWSRTWRMDHLSWPDFPF